MSVGCCGPFDADEEDPDSDYDRLAIEAEALRVENRLLMRELAGNARSHQKRHRDA